MKIKNVKLKLHKLAPKNVEVTKAYLFRIYNGLDTLVDSEEMLKEQNKLSPDTKAFMYGRVVNKKARYNLCFARAKLSNR